MQASDIGLGIFQMLSPVLLAAISWIAAKVGQLINAHVKNEYLRGVLMRLDDAVLSVVREVHQVTVAAIKEASVDGRLPPGARETVKNAAVARIQSYLGRKGLAEVARVLGLNLEGVDRLIGTKVEAAVHDLKVQQKVVNGVNLRDSPVGDAVPFDG